MQNHKLYCQFIVSVLVQTICICDGAINIELSSSRDNNDINMCILKLIERIQSSVSDVTLVNIYDNSLGATIHMEGIRVVTRTFLWINGTLHNSVYIVTSENYKDLKEGFELIKKEPYWNPRAKFIIAVEFLDEMLQNVTDLLFDNYVFNVSVISTVNEEDYAIYGFSPLLDSCNRPAIKTLRFLSYCDVFNENIEVFPITKHRKMKDCNVKLVSHNYWPFISFNEKTTTGIERYMLELIHESEGINAEIVHFKRNEIFGTIFDNFTHTGMLEKVDTNEVEGAIGGYIILPLRAMALDYVYPYMIDHNKLIIPRANKLDKWQAVYAQLKLSTVCYIFIMFIIFLAIVVQLKIFTKKKKDTIRDILIVYGYFLNNINVKTAKIGGIARIIILNMLIFTFIVSCLIQASLLSTTTKPLRDYQISSPEEVYYNRYNLVLTSEKEYQVGKIKHKCKNTFDCLTRVKNSRNEYTIVSNIYYDQNIWKLANKDGDLKVYKIKEPTNTALLTIYFHRGSTLLIPFNRFIERANNGGLLNQYLHYIHFMERLKYHFHQNSSSQPLKLSDLKEIFLIYLMGAILSIAIFIYEYKS